MEEPTRIYEESRRETSTRAGPTNPNAAEFIVVLFLFVIADGLDESRSSPWAENTARTRAVPELPSARPVMLCHGSNCYNDGDKTYTRHIHFLVF